MLLLVEEQQNNVTAFHTALHRVKLRFSCAFVHQQIFSHPCNEALTMLTAWPVEWFG